MMDFVQFEDAAVVVLTYSVASKESFNSVPKWLNSVKAALSAHMKNPIVILVGTKTDLRDAVNPLESRGEVTTAEGQNLAASLNAAGFYEVSAAMNKGVEDVFRGVAEQFHKRYEEIAQSLGHRWSSV